MQAYFTCTRIRLTHKKWKILGIILLLEVDKTYRSVYSDNLRGVQIILLLLEGLHETMKRKGNDAKLSVFTSEIGLFNGRKALVEVLQLFRTGRIVLAEKKFP